jgi:hypothetical protein
MMNVIIVDHQFLTMMNAMLEYLMYLIFVINESFIMINVLIVVHQFWTILKLMIMKN